MRRATFFWSGVLLGVVFAVTLAGCQVGVHGSAYYPENGWRQGGDPADSRLSSQGIQPRGFSGMGGAK